MRLMKYTGVAVWAIATAGVAIGAGCSDTAVIFDPNFDGAVADSAADSTVRVDGSGGDSSADASRDGSSSDAGGDGGNNADSGSDGGNNADGGSDSGSDGGASDASDDGGTDGGGSTHFGDAGDGGTLLTFSDNVTAAICEKLAGCCDPGFSTAKCANEVTGLGRGGPSNIWQGMEVAGVKSGGRVTLNTSLADQCLALVAATNFCAPESGATARQLMATCGGALQGTAPVGAACRTDIECVSGNYCAGAVVSSAVEGTCTPLSGAGETCNFERAGYIGRVTNCSSRGYGETGLYCVQGVDKCSALKATGEACVNDFECANQYCTFGADFVGSCGDAPADQGFCFFGL